MVKDEHHKTRTLTDGENEFSIAREQSVYGLIYRIQEEAHRFAVKRSSEAKRKTLRRSSLCDIKGIGERKAKILLTAFGGVGKLSVASAEDIASVKGITRTDAENIVKHFEAKTKKS
jgi:excinuclease ABC subunit C